MSTVNDTNQNKNGLQYSIEFTKLGRYDDTHVEMKASIPFRRLHFLFLFPALILKQYWNSALSASLNEGDTNNIMKEYLSTEKEHTDQLNHLSECVNLFDDFPNIRKTKNGYGIKLSWKERIIGRIRVN